MEYKLTNRDNFNHLLFLMRYEKQIRLKKITDTQSYERPRKFIITLTQTNKSVIIKIIMILV